MNQYMYDGPVMEFDTCVANRWQGSTYAASANLVVMKIEQKDQALRIRKLEKEIEELKRPEGE